MGRGSGLGGGKSGQRGAISASDIRSVEKRLELLETTAARLVGLEVAVGKLSEPHRHEVPALGPLTERVGALEALVAPAEASSNLAERMGAAERHSRVADRRLDGLESSFVRVEERQNRLLNGLGDLGDAP